MSTKTGIQWTDATWNPIRGCSRVSAGCQNCYAEAVAARFSGPGLPYEGLARRRSNGEPQWTGEVRVIEHHLYDPLKWREPRRVFVNSMSDLFHEQLVVDDIAHIFAVMALAPQHTFQVLTKRAAGMRETLTNPDWLDILNAHIEEIAFAHSDPQNRRKDDLRATAPEIGEDNWPLPNVWLGVSVENQAAANERIPLLLDTPAALRFLSCEPLLGAVDLRRIKVAGGVTDALGGWYHEGGRQVDWVIVGGESGKHARPFDIEWGYSILRQCRDAEVACFVKQLGAHVMNAEGMVDVFGAGVRIENDRVLLRDSHGANTAEWPMDLCVREFPALRT